VRSHLEPRSNAAFRANPASPTPAIAATVAGADMFDGGPAGLVAADSSATSCTPSLLLLASPAYRSSTSDVRAVTCASC